MVRLAPDEASETQFNDKSPKLVYENKREKATTQKSQIPDVESVNAPFPSAQSTVRFDRKELNQILRIYGFKVASGEWRDYAIDMLKDRAVFSVFRRTSEVPLFAIEKTPKLARRQGAYSVVNGNGLIIKRGQELTQVLKIFDKKPRLAAV